MSHAAFIHGVPWVIAAVYACTSAAFVVMGVRTPDMRGLPAVLAALFGAAAVVFVLIAEFVP